MNEYTKIFGSIILLFVLSHLIEQYNTTKFIELTTSVKKPLLFNKEDEIHKIEDVLSDVKTQLKTEMSKEVDLFVEEELKKSGENGEISSHIVNIISNKLKTKYFDPSDDLLGSLNPSDSHEDSPILYNDLSSHFNLDDSNIQYKSVSLKETPSETPKPRKSYDIDGQQFYNPCDPSEKFGLVNANDCSFDNYAPF
jgi:hypothetical protein